jgi:MFS family permease
MPSEAAHVTLQLPIRRAGALTFGTLFALESFVRAINATVVSLQAYDLLHTARNVSILATAVSLTVLVTTLLLPVLIAHLPRRWSYTLGVLGLMGAGIALASFTLSGQALGMFLRNSGAALLNIAMSLYILDYVKRADLTKIEPVRMSMSTASWTVGPAFGVWLYTEYGHWAPQAMSIAWAGVLLSLFWYLRLHSHAIIRAGKASAPNPIANIGRFLRQPRLRLAWMIAFGRSCYWATLFVYGPLLMVESGLGKQVGGWLISISQILLVSAYLFGKLAERQGVRVVIAGSFAVACVSAIMAGLAGTAMPYLAGALLLLGSIAASALDGVGGIPFLRAVRAHERPQMTAVYRTYIDLSELVPSILFALALTFFEIGAVFVIIGLTQGIVGIISWKHLPKSM